MISTNKEEWKPIKGFTNYQVSNLGRVRSFKTNKWKVLKPRKKDCSKVNTYVSVLLCKDNKPQYKSIHRLVALAFIINKEDKPEINHKNGLRNDNRVHNIEWVTKSENMVHKSLMAGKNKNDMPLYVYKRSENSYRVRIKSLKVERWFSNVEAAKSFAVQYYPNRCMSSA